MVVVQWRLISGGSVTCLNGVNGSVYLEENQVSLIWAIRLSLLWLMLIMMALWNIVVPLQHPAGIYILNSERWYHTVFSV